MSSGVASDSDLVFIEDPPSEGYSRLFVKPGYLLIEKHNAKKEETMTETPTEVLEVIELEEDVQTKKLPITLEHRQKRVERNRRLVQKFRDKRTRLITHIEGLWKSLKGLDEKIERFEKYIQQDIKKIEQGNAEAGPTEQSQESNNVDGA